MILLKLMLPSHWGERLASVCYIDFIKHLQQETKKNG